MTKWDTLMWDPPIFFAFDIIVDLKKTLFEAVRVLNITFHVQHTLCSIPHEFNYYLYCQSES